MSKATSSTKNGTEKGGPKANAITIEDPDGFFSLWLRKVNATLYGTAHEPSQEAATVLFMAGLMSLSEADPGDSRGCVADVCTATGLPDPDPDHPDA